MIYTDIFIFGFSISMPNKCMKWVIGMFTVKKKYPIIVIEAGDAPHIGKHNSQSMVAEPKGNYNSANKRISF